MSHHARALDHALAYHQHTSTTITTASGHLIAAALAAQVADAEFSRADEATTSGGQRMFLTAANKALRTRNVHQLAAELTAIGEQVIDL